MTVAVTDLGLDLCGVPQDEVDAAQELLAVEALTPGQVRDLLRPLCGPEQDGAELIAQACLDIHVPRDDSGKYVDWCVECSRSWPCPKIAADLHVLGVFE